jgi:hypothetical protein
VLDFRAAISGEQYYLFGAVQGLQMTDKGAAVLPRFIMEAQQGSELVIDQKHAFQPRADRGQLQA